MHNNIEMFLDQYEIEQVLSKTLLGFDIDLKVLETIMTFSNTDDAATLIQHMLEEEIDAASLGSLRDVLLNAEISDLSAHIDTLSPSAQKVAHHLYFAIHEVFQAKNPSLSEFDALRERMHGIFFANNWTRSDFDSKCAVEDDEYLMLKIMLASNPGYYKENISFHSRYPDLETCLDVAQKNHNGPMITLLLDAGDGKYIDLELDAKKSAVAKAARLGNIEVFEWLMRAGRSPNKDFYNKISALALAAEHGHVDIVALLLTAQGCRDAATAMLAAQVQHGSPNATVCHTSGVAAFDGSVGYGQQAKSEQDHQHLTWLRCLSMAFFSCEAPLSEEGIMSMVSLASTLSDHEVAFTDGLIHIQNKAALISRIVETLGVESIRPMLERCFGVTIAPAPYSPRVRFHSHDQASQASTPDNHTKHNHFK